MQTYCVDVDDEFLFVHVIVAILIVYCTICVLSLYYSCWNTLLKLICNSFNNLSHISIVADLYCMSDDMRNVMIEIINKNSQNITCIKFHVKCLLSRHNKLSIL